MNSDDVRDINKAYISPYDIFLSEFDKTQRPSAAQQQEIDKHQRIASLRDHANPNAAAKDNDVYLV
jgi:hypothetical protein